MVFVINTVLPSAEIAPADSVSVLEKKVELESSKFLNETIAPPFTAEFSENVLLTISASELRIDIAPPVFDRFWENELSSMSRLDDVAATAPPAPPEDKSPDTRVSFSDHVASKVVFLSK